MSADPALLDTSVLIARESGRPLRNELVPDRTAVCIITIAELHLGVLAATDTATRSRRLATVEAVGAVEPLPVTPGAARHGARLRARLSEQGRRAKINDLWTAAVAAGHGMAVVTQDDDFDVIEQAGGPTVIRV